MAKCKSSQLPRFHETNQRELIQVGKICSRMGARVIHEQLEPLLWRSRFGLEAKVSLQTCVDGDSETIRSQTELDNSVV